METEKQEARNIQITGYAAPGEPVYTELNKLTAESFGVLLSLFHVRCIFHPVVKERPAK